MTISKDSIYEHLNAPTNVMKQHFVEYFSGDSLNSFVWGIRKQASSPQGSVAMSDSVDGGLVITSNASTTATRHFAIGFCADGLNNTVCTSRPFNYASSTVIANMKWGSAEDYDASGAGGGFNSDANVSGGTDHTSGVGAGAMLNVRNSNFIGIRMMDNSGSQSCGSSCTCGMSADTNWHSTKIELDGTKGHATIDGVLRSSASDRYPAYKMGLCYHSGSDSNTAQTFQINYVEAFNT